MIRGSLAVILSVACMQATACGEKPLDPAAEAAKLASDLTDARTRVKDGNIDDAERIYLRILEKQPENPDALYGMGEVRYHEKDYDMAKSLMERAIAAKGDDPGMHFRLGHVHELKGDLAGAVSAYGKAFQLDDDNSDYGMSLGIALKKSKNFAEGEAVFRKVLEIDPMAYFANTELGDCIREQGRYEEALKAYMKAQSVNASDKMAHAGAGMVYEALKDTKHALDQWSAYIRMDCCSEFSNNVAKKKIVELQGPAPTAGVAPSGAGEPERKPS